MFQHYQQQWMKSKFKIDLKQNNNFAIIIQRIGGITNIIPKLITNTHRMHQVTQILR